MFQALIFLVLQLALGVWLFMQLDEYRSVISHFHNLCAPYALFSLTLGLSSLGLVVLYPLMKRINDLPQIVLGKLLQIPTTAVTNLTR
jgi:4-hydroxybenzoate polyprenyltransferase